MTRPSNECRRNPLTRRWTIFASHDIDIFGLVARVREALAAEKSAQPVAEPCPFCPGNEHLTPPEILVSSAGQIRYRRNDQPSSGQWDIRVISNRNPVFQIEGKIDRRAVRAYDVLTALGANEIVVETRQHLRSFQDLSEAHSVNILAVYRERAVDLARNPALGHFFAFKNIGGFNNIRHPYTQILASPVIPDLVRDELDASYEHFERKERCLTCDIVTDHMRGGRDCLVVGDDPRFVSFSPYFARRPFEIWVVPVNHSADFKTATDEDLQHAAKVVLRTLRKLESALGRVTMTIRLLTMPNIGFGHTRGYWKTLQDDYHWRIVIIPRLPVLADLYRWFVSGSGFSVNPVLPEQAAWVLQQAKE